MLTHLSTWPITELLKVTQDEPPCFKPKGLWYSVDGSWEEWGTGKSFGMAGKMAYELTLGHENILRLGTPEEIARFDMKYPDWRRLADEYDGIEIAPYQWSLRLDMRTIWYYGWDCASGCVWRPRGATLKYSKERTDDLRRSQGVLEVAS